MRTEQNGRHFAGDIFKRMLLITTYFIPTSLFSLMVQLILCHQWFRYWFYAKQTLLPEQIRIEFFIQQLGFNPRCWLIIKLTSIFQSHIYPLNSAYLSIGTFTLTSRCCHWNCTKPLLGEYMGGHCLLYIPGKVYHLHYDVLVKKYFQHYWPFVRETTGGSPSRKTSDMEHWCSLWCQSEQTFEQTLYEQVIWYVLKLIWRRCNEL